MDIKVFKDGNQVCALFGRDLQEGIAGFGYSIPEALESLAAEWRLSPIRPHWSDCATNNKSITDTHEKQNLCDCGKI